MVKDCINKDYDDLEAVKEFIKISDAEGVGTIQLSDHCYNTSKESIIDFSVIKNSSSSVDVSNASLTEGECLNIEELNDLLFLQQSSELSSIWKNHSKENEEGDFRSDNIKNSNCKILQANKSEKVLENPKLLENVAILSKEEESLAEIRSPFKLVISSSMVNNRSKQKLQKIT